MKETVAWAYGVFKIPLSSEELPEFSERWHEFIEAYGDGVEFQKFIVSSIWDKNEARLIDSVLSVLGQLEELDFEVIEALQGDLL